MFDTLQKSAPHGTPTSRFFGGLTAESAWDIDIVALIDEIQRFTANRTPILLAGTAFSYVHLLDHLTDHGMTLPLPPGSLVLETGGYKGRSRELPKEELHAWIQQRFGVAREQVIVEYGMSELSSQAYDRCDESGRRTFQFPPWTRWLVVSPETGLPVKEGETGLIRIFDLANVWSVMAIQTEDLGVLREGNRFELLGRATGAQARGCSLMTL